MRVSIGVEVLLAIASVSLMGARSLAAEHVAGETFRDCETCGEMVVVPAGTFMMGSTAKASQSPPHKVTIANDFAIGRKEVTVAEWNRCVTGGACAPSLSDPGAGRDDLPVANVSWSDAKAFVTWLSTQTGRKYRLPSEAEWEYSARAGSATTYWWGKDIGVGRARCADCGDRPSGVGAVGSYRPNPFGLYDTAGNAAEWVEDCWNPNYAGAPSNGAAWSTGDCGLRVLRGGSFLDKAVNVSSAARFRYDYDVRYIANGFRIARELK